MVIRTSRAPHRADQSGIRDIDARPTVEILEIINQEDQKIARAVAAEIPKSRSCGADRGANPTGGRLFYIGAGTSGRLGVLDAAECPPTFHVPPDLVQGIIAGGEAALARATEATEDDPEAGRRDLADRGFAAETLWWGSRPAAGRLTCWAPSTAARAWAR